MIDTPIAPEIPEMIDAPIRQKPGPKPRPSFSMDDLAKLIVDSQTETREQIEALAARVEAAEQKAAKALTATPQFVQSGVETWGNRELQDVGALAGVADMRAGQERTGLLDRLPTTSKGGRIPEEILAQYQQRFQKGQRVRINPDATRDGATRTWAEVLETPLGQKIAPVGVIRDVMFLSGSGWKYLCRFDGMLGARGGEDCFHESELLGA